MLEHGGNLNDAIARFGQPQGGWLDLSTGINPQPYPVPALPPDAWHRLPQPEAALFSAAEVYYRAPHLLPVAGTQAAIQALPRLRFVSQVVIAAPAYSEHTHCWKQAGHIVREVASAELEAALPDCDVMVICNPGNPNGTLIEPKTLLVWAEQLAAKGGWLLVDEAFIDTTPEHSVAAWADKPSLIVLRSPGKFFGLAGLRLGFVAAEQKLLATLADHLGPWTVSGPAQRIGTTALMDYAWQATTRTRLLKDGERLKALLKKHGIESSGTALYQWWATADAEAFHKRMAERGIWVRLFAKGTQGIRIGLSGDEAGWKRLEEAL